MELFVNPENDLIGLGESPKTSSRSRDESCSRSCGRRELLPQVGSNKSPPPMRPGANVFGSGGLVSGSEAALTHTAQRAAGPGTVRATTEPE